jgi:hypothetical protein
MRPHIVSVLFALLIATSSAEADSLSLVCSGTIKRIAVGKEGAVEDSEKDSVEDFSILLDFDQRTVSGFWAELTGLPNPIPIIGADANSVVFKGSKKVLATDANIFGTVDRITGRVEATETWLYSNSHKVVGWDLRCKPGKPLF